ncbi:outer membrane protein OmpA-like peptidoglycan-associated protein/tetratricopeptide (TPR) repeat protein [Filimonas zeae]|nr:OmpA family protein [Filimonas zeae]MDR6342119.1 outer membrane protein OmpA-like peptidoglycan-associated protein/tetratricopeptide (TPR) repeat protein [Filimonas zeae]
MKYLYILLFRGSCYIVALLLCSHMASAQYNLYDLKRTADMYFEKGDYYSAAQYYDRFLTTKRSVAKGNVNADDYLPYMVTIATRHMKKQVSNYEQVVYRLAESYRMYFDFNNAEKWYAMSTNFDSIAYPLARYWYGVTLRANTKYTDAENQFSRFLLEHTSEDEYSKSARKELANCRFIQGQLAEDKRSVLVSRLDGFINQGGATYAPAWLDNKTMVFTSSRGDSAAIIRTKGTNPYFNNVYQTTLQDSGYSKPIKVNVEVNGEMQQGAAAFTSDGRRMYLTRWQLVEGKNRGSLFMSEKSGSNWSAPVKLGLNVNTDGYSSIQPYVTTDGKYLIFSSDRPGGVGKYDLWYSLLDPASGQPGSAANMGTMINTEGDEQAPFYHNVSTTLVFASNGRVGMGGFDLYSSKGNFAVWDSVKNMGHPLNSTKDDIYFSSRGKKFLLADANFSSDRSSVCCLEMFGVKRKNMVITGKVVDCATREPMAGATISVVDTLRNKVIYTQDIDATGAYSFEMEEYQPLKLVGEKKYYLPRSLHFFKPGSEGAPDTLVNPDLCMNHEDTAKPFPVGQAVVLKDIYYDFDKATLRPESYPVLDTLASVMRRFPNMELEMSSHTDGKGAVKYNLKLSDARAKSCVEYLQRVGIEMSRLRYKGYGKCCPIAPNTLPNGKDNPDGRALNRRTEVKVIHY